MHLQDSTNINVPMEDSHTIQPPEEEDAKIDHEIVLPIDPGKRKSMYDFDTNEKYRAAEDLMNQKQHIEVVLSNQTEQSCLDYRTRLVATIDVIRLCLRQGLAFRGHDESEDSLKRGNFLTILEFHVDHNKKVKKVVLDHAPGNNKLIAPNIQKFIINAMAIETNAIILQDLRDELFSILVDESRDISVKEHMVLLIRFVDKYGCVIERFLGVVHVNDTTSMSLKLGVEELLNKHIL
ncbi:Zinc finger MYM-type protein 1-like [Heracleum sosnowskyi]|uniref:Zinc finger MYM-type protein 1-like n=1 Tax=Heracleum sosnowskyi TaxID=360622 RepID=A0AAD8JLA8_9APIA|nr:Zinc finger MYM-type protein 1-like [Heracleum sosnowskyi]